MSLKSLMLKSALITFAVVLQVLFGEKRVVIDRHPEQLPTIMVVLRSVASREHGGGKAILYFTADEGMIYFVISVNDEKFSWMDDETYSSDKTFCIKVSAE